MKKIILFYEHKVRELGSYNQLKSILENDYGYDVYILSIVFEWTKGVILAKRHRIDSVVMPWLNRVDDYRLMQPFIKSNPKVKIYNLHQEQICSPVTEKVVKIDDECVKNTVMHFAWGEFFKKKLIDWQVDSDNIFISGNMRNDEGGKSKYTKDEIARTFSLDLNKEWLLFTETRGWVKSSNRSNEKIFRASGIDEDVIVEFKEHTMESLLKTINEFNQLPNRFFDKYELIYRPHPGQINSFKLNDKIKVISEYSIYEWIAVVDANISWSSTSLFESEINNVPSFFYEPIVSMDKFRPYGIGDYRRLKKITDIEKINLKEMKQDMNCKKYRKIYVSYLGEVDGRATRKIAEKIAELDNKNEVNFKNLYIGLSKRNLRQLLFEIVTYITYKLNILNILKYPSSAYTEKRDIPY